MTIDVKIFLDEPTANFTYVVTDVSSKSCMVIDSVLNYDQYSGRSSTKSADEIIEYIKTNNLKLEWVLDTHIHADHLTATNYIHKKLGGKTGIGEHIKQVLDHWIPVFNTGKDTKTDASQWDYLFKDNEIFKLGSVDVKVLHTPGHTPACLSYYIEDAVFVGDTIFMPDLGTARTDFPGGSADIMYDSIMRLYSLPDETRIFCCHDYPPSSRKISSLSTVADQKINNILLNQNTQKQDYVKLRNQRDDGKEVPKLLLPSIQVNLRLGEFGQPEDNNIKYIKIPVDTI